MTKAKQVSKQGERKTKAQILFQGQSHHKKQRKLVILNQWIEIEVENGQTITKL